MFSTQLSRPRLRISSLFHPAESTKPLLEIPDESALLGEWRLVRVNGRGLPAAVWPENGSSMVAQLGDALQLLPGGIYRSNSTYRFTCASTGRESTAGWEFAGNWKLGKRLQFRTSYGACYTGCLKGDVLTVHRSFGTYEYVSGSLWDDS